MRQLFTLSLFTILSLYSIGQSTYRFTEQGSPYSLFTDLTVHPADSFIMEPGAEVYLSPSVDIQVYGYFSIAGSSLKPALLHTNNFASWSSIVIHPIVDSIFISFADFENIHLAVEDCNIYYDNVTFSTTPQLLWDETFSTFEGGHVEITNTRINGTNEGEGLLFIDVVDPTVSNSEFYEIPDAVEFIHCESGRILSNRFDGMDDDAIDLNHCKNIEIAHNIISNVTDRGIEIGNENFGNSLDINVHHNIVYACGEGITFKEGASGLVSHCTVVQNGQGLSSIVSYKPPRPSHVHVENTIFFDNDTTTYLDSTSTIISSHCSSNWSEIPGVSNYMSDPLFVDTTALNFNLSHNSPCIDKGVIDGSADPDGTRPDLGALYFHRTIDNEGKDGLLIYPNPFSDQLGISFKSTFEKIEIIDAVGKSVLVIENLEELQYTEVNVQHLRSGIYWLQTTKSSETSTHPLIKL